MSVGSALHVALPTLGEQPALINGRREPVEVSLLSFAINHTSFDAASCRTQALLSKGVSRQRSNGMSNNMAKIADARKTVEQLKLEVNIERMMVSRAAADLMAYCETHAKDDPLVTPVPSSENPFREKKIFCEIL
ncbi:guanine nucleotide-binding protein G(I)/G(S)/G(O) subunit gamma-8 isoform X1 [Phyllopteryx taeniolatus]|uniref:guanine nucleotide-binding protein G(I)/G(S)/G(O) subunit gamma-8 isoform X1 n=2 Tax=Phyllopteryx taeniolatus TaxID=161469 RepID=UPI002AD3EAF3|nr:guanine nucleotide-binding protein G(I)/G(S)/G(O) subunit gamma-8 isoform X1 [Phyllopteryx taeniolatus]